MELLKVKVQKSKGSFFVYIPKSWAKSMGIEKGRSLTWVLDEKCHEKLILGISEVKKR